MLDPVLELRKQGQLHHRVPLAWPRKTRRNSFSGSGEGAEKSLTVGAKTTSKANPRKSEVSLWGWSMRCTGYLRDQWGIHILRGLGFHAKAWVCVWACTEDNGK